MLGRWAVILGCVSGCATTSLPRSGLECPAESSVKTANDGERGSREWCEDDNTSGHGAWVRYFPSGVRAEQANVDHGKIHGQYFKFFESGKTQMVTEWRSYHREGLEVRWFENGNVEWAGRYVNDQREGEWTGYFATGTASFRGIYRGGTPNGVWVFWNADGSTAHVEDFARTGPTRVFDENQVLREVSVVTNGQLVEHWVRPW